MKLMTFQVGGKTYVGKLDGEQIYPLATSDSMLDILDSGNIPDTTDNPFDLKDVEIQAPLMPRKIICVGRNYAEHASELGNKLPEKPLLFAKYPTCVIGTGETIMWSTDVTQQVDWEGELAVVIGKRAKNITEEQALDYVFGYSVANDVSARDLQSREKQWVRAKAQDTFLPLGSAIVTADEIPDPQNLSVKTWVNGELKQDGNTKDMVFGVAYLVAYCSKTFTLEPGDLIITGTPSGVGKAQTPPQFLDDGDSVKITIEGVGTIENPCKVV